MHGLEVYITKASASIDNDIVCFAYIAMCAKQCIQEGGGEGGDYL